MIITFERIYVCVVFYILIWCAKLGMCSKKKTVLDAPDTSLILYRANNNGLGQKNNTQRTKYNANTNVLKCGHLIVYGRGDCVANVQQHVEI